MISGIHFLLTYACTYECDHCFLYCNPFSEGTFTIRQIHEILEDAKNIETFNTVYLEGGEPFLYYMLMLETVKIANQMGLKVGIVTNAYWAKTVEDAELYLKPLIEIGISDLSLSDDEFHFGEEIQNCAKNAHKAAENLGLPSGSICIEKPTVISDNIDESKKGEPVIGGDVMFRGRAVDKLTEGLPMKNISNFTECPHEELISPKRIHLDPYGNLHICQGLCMGRISDDKPLSEIVKNYDPYKHPICGPLIKGGPKLLAETYDINIGDEFVDHCHFCYLVRKALIDKFPEYLCPEQTYGLEK